MSSSWGYAWPRRRSSPSLSSAWDAWVGESKMCCQRELGPRHDGDLIDRPHTKYAQIQALTYTTNQNVRNSPKRLETVQPVRPNFEGRRSALGGRATGPDPTTALLRATSALSHNTPLPEASAYKRVDGRRERPYTTWEPEPAARRYFLSETCKC